MKKSKRLIVLMFVITSIVVVVTVVNFFIDSDAIRQILSDVQYIGIFISLLTFFVQQLIDQRSEETSFFIKLKNAFIMDNTLMQVYDELYKYYMDNSYSLEHLEQRKIVQYLAYFDSVAIACENKIISIEEIDKTFCYYFFIAVNNPTVQQKELVAEGEFYPRLYWLYYQLHQCQISNNMPLIMEETALHTTSKYDMMIKRVK